MRCGCIERRFERTHCIDGIFEWPYHFEEWLSPASLRSGSLVANGGTAAPSVSKEREASTSSGRKKEQIEPASLNGRSKERVAVSASLNGTALTKSTTSKGRDKSTPRGRVLYHTLTGSTTTTLLWMAQIEMKKRKQTTVRYNLK